MKNAKARDQSAQSRSREQVPFMTATVPRESIESAVLVSLSEVTLSSCDKETARAIDPFTVVCWVTWPLNVIEAAGDLVLMKTSLFLLCKSSCSNVNFAFTLQKQRGLYQRKVTCSLTAIQRPGSLK